MDISEKCFGFQKEPFRISCCDIMFVQLKYEIFWISQLFRISHFGYRFGYPKSFTELLLRFALKDHAAIMHFVYELHR